MKKIKRTYYFLAVISAVIFIMLFTACYVDNYKAANGIWVTDDVVSDTDAINANLNIHDVVEDATLSVYDTSAYLTVNFKTDNRISSPSISSGLYELIPGSVEKELISWKLCRSGKESGNSLNYTDDLIYICFSFEYENVRLDANLYFVRHA